MSETTIAYCGKTPECPNANDNSSHHIVIPINSINELGLNNFGFKGKTAEEILEATAEFYKCSCGLIFRITKEGDILNLIKIEAQ